MRIWAIADLHLGFSTGKWMDRFGDHWRGHADRVAAAWRDRVGLGDIVLLPGDFSWAMKLDEVVEDFRWLDGLPGRKVLIKGNHDYWWGKSKKKLSAVLPAGVHMLKKTAAVIDGVPIVGVRGCDFFPGPGKDPAAVEAELAREQREFQLSIEHLAGLEPGRHPPIALFHYPPFPCGVCESPLTRMAAAIGCRHALYGHLHSQGEWTRYFQGESRGISYRLVSSDFLDFTPALVDEVD